MKLLSAVIITYNEEQQILRCLESLSGIADEIIVLDSGSTDDTVKICRDFGATVHIQPFLGYIEQKNKALEFATHDYALSLDADEALDEKLRKSILKEKKAGFPMDGYKMNRLTLYIDTWIRHGTWYPDTKLRLWNRHKGQWAGTNPHDRYEMETGSKIKKLPGDILHYSYHSVQQHIDQMHRFTSVAAEAMFRKGRKAPWSKILLSPFANFIKGMIIRRAFLDGYYGVVICFINSFSVFLRYVKLRELITKSKSEKN